jgi:hypothetical protein
MEVTVVTEAARGTRWISAGPTLLVLFALTQVAAMVVAGVVILGTVQDTVVNALDAAGDSAVGEPAALVLVFGAAISAVVALVAGLIALIVIPGVRRFGGTARVTGLVVAVLIAVWVGVVAALNPVGGPVSLFSAAADTNGAMTATELRNSINAALPAWYQPTHLTVAGITVILAILLVTVLARSGGRGQSPS